jgi:hypothetical protein
VSHPARDVRRSRSIRRLPTLNSVAVGTCLCGHKWRGRPLDHDRRADETVGGRRSTSYLEIRVDTAGRPAVRAHGVSVHLAVTQLPSYCTGAPQAGGASTRTSRLAPRRHSFALGCGFGSPVVCGVGGVSSDGEAWRGDPPSGPTRPRRRSRLRARSTPLATVHAERGANGRFGGRPAD